MINHGGYLSNGRAMAIQLTLFFTILMYLSISGMCSSVAHIFIGKPLSYIIFCKCLNCPSPRKVHTLNPCITCLMDINMVLFFMSFTSLAVPMYMLRDVVITNGILLMNITSIASVPFLCLSIISSGKLCAFNFTCYLSAARINKMLWCSISALFSDSNFCYSVGLSIFTLFNMLLPPFLDVPTLSPSCSHTFLYVINWSWYSCKDSYLSYWI